MPSLTRDEAEVRARLIQVDGYHIELDLSSVGDAGDFASTTTIRFRCIRPGASTFAEITCAELVRATLNGEPVDPSALAGNRLPLVELAATNELVVHARMAYSNAGEGLHRFTDPADGEVYLYAQSFLDNAQRIFACFDQPDLKAPVTLVVATPPAWEVAGNGPGQALGPGRWEFVTTQQLPTYLVSLVAGPYHVRRDSHDGIPLGVYARRGLAPHLDKDLDEILDVTKASLDRYHELFGVRYPFDKFDQAFVPEFNAGAMENAGLVVLRDEYLFRSAVADDERENRALVIAHELAHMWFGDLVTMRWWDDLWLNESFAEYLGFRVVAEVTRFTRAWTGFAVGRKGWGYAADQRPSTHPVAPTSVPDCASALLNFDGISYAKGAAVLRQLAAWLGEEPFLAGLRAHIDAHAYGNATLDDLLRALGTASGRDLAPWAERWLRRAQVNTLRPETVVGADGRYASVAVVQTAPAQHPTLRPQRIGIGVYSGGSRHAAVLVDLDPDADGGRTTVPDLVGVPAGLLLLNDGDLGYAKIRFDATSRAALHRTVSELTDPLPRALIWGAVTDAVRDADVPVTDLVDLVVAGIAVESQVTVVRDLIRYVTARPIDAQYPVTGLAVRYVPPALVASLQARVAKACWAAMVGTDPAGGRILFARGYVAAAGEADAQRLHTWLDDPRAAGADGVDVDAEMRWAILTRLAALGALGEDEIAGELDRDRSASGAEHAARCRAVRPDPAAKATAWRTIMEGDNLSNRLVTAAAEGLWHPGQLDLMESYVERYFTDLPILAARRTPAVVAQVAAAAFPRYAVSQQTLAQAQDLLAQPALDPTLNRVVVDQADELRRALAGRALVERSLAEPEVGHDDAG